MIEELDDIAEELADKLGIYSEPRQHWTYEFKQRIRNCAEFRAAAPASQPNPPDCSCEHVHASSPTCRSKEPSRGAVKESERLFPAAARMNPCWCDRCNEVIPGWAWDYHERTCRGRR